MSDIAKKKLDLIEVWIKNGELESNLAIIQSLAMQGMTLTEIAGEFDISERQLRRLRDKHMSVMSALKSGRKSVVAMTQNRLIDLINEGNITAIIYALKIYGGIFFHDNKYELELREKEFELRKRLTEKETTGNLAIVEEWIAAIMEKRK